MLSTVATTNVLVVEDDQSIRETVAEVLESGGFKVFSCTNGADALLVI